MGAIVIGAGAIADELCTLANIHLACYAPPPQRYPILMYLGSRFENERLCAKENGPNLNGCCFINTKGGGVAGEVVIRQLCTAVGEGTTRAFSKIPRGVELLSPIAQFTGAN